MNNSNNEFVHFLDAICNTVPFVVPPIAPPPAERSMVAIMEQFHKLQPFTSGLVMVRKNKNEFFKLIVRKRK